MTKRAKRWTARVLHASSDIALVAQCKSSKAELMRRLVADDPIWSREGVRYSMESPMPKKWFRRGLAIKAVAKVDEIRGNK